MPEIADGELPRRRAARQHDAVVERRELERPPHRGVYEAAGKNEAESRNIGIVTSWILSKSVQLRMKVAPAMPTDANASPMSRQIGRASSSHHVWASPSRGSVTRNATA